MTVKVGILGFAHGHVESYCNLWREDESMCVRVVAGWDHDAERLKGAAERHKIEICDSPDAVLKKVDAVVIASETSMHADLAESAAHAGKAIIIQKPLALTLDQADRIVAAVDKAAVPFTMAWQMRADPQNIRMRELVQSGELGRIFMVRRRHGLSTHTWPGFENSWHNNPAFNRDIWADDAAHPADFIYWLLGMPESVTAELATLCNPKVPNDNGIAIFRYPGGPIAEVFCSFVSVAGENTTEIVGEKGVVIQNYGDGPSCSAPRPEDAVGLKWFLQADGRWTDSGIPSPKSHGERIAGLSRPLADFLNNRRPPIATAHEGRDVLRMVLACYESSRLAKRIAL